MLGWNYCKNSLQEVGHLSLQDKSNLWWNFGFSLPCIRNHQGTCSKHHYPWNPYLWRIYCHQNYICFCYWFSEIVHLRILVLLAPLGCHTISSSCCIRVKTLKLTLIKTKAIWLVKNKTDHVYHKMPNHVTFSDEISNSGTPPYTERLKNQ